MEQLKLILNYVVGFASSATGAALIAFVIRAIVKKSGEVKIAKAAKLSDADKHQIAQECAEIVTARFKSKLTLDVDAQIDRSTNKRLKVVEDSQAQLVDVVNRTYKLAKANARAFGSFHTVAAESKKEISELLDADNGDLVEVQEEKPSVVFEKQTEEEKQEAVEKKADRLY